jgi:hypothetical protein
LPDMVATSSSRPARPTRPLRTAAVSLAAAAALLLGPAAWAAKPTARVLRASGQLVQTAKPGRFMAVQQGTIRGTPFGTATMVLRSTLKQARVTATFSVTAKAGRVAGNASARLTLDGDTATYKGTATITSGSGRYRHATGSKIAFTGVGPVDAKHTQVTLSGRVSY